MTWRAWARRDALVLALGLLLLALWEASRWDMPLQRLAGGPQGFPLANAWFTKQLLHEGGRWLAAGVLVLQLAALWRRPRAGAPGRGERAFAIAITVAAMAWVPVLKRFSHTSCPYNLVEFGGTVPYVPHWVLNLVDGGPGHCFPSGHAVAAFGFFSLYFLWRGHDARRARTWRWGVLAVGTVFAWAQLVRGAHFASHSMWSAWWCYGVCAAAFALRGAWPVAGSKGSRTIEAPAGSQQGKTP
jgi:membrane-associated PAP2 superfamily phosphatase